MKTKLIALFCACFLLLNIVDMLIPRTEAKVYDKELAALIECWREIYRDGELPFVAVQLADYFDKDGNYISEGWRIMQETQLNLPNICKNTEVVKCADVCETDDIHPVTKAPLAKRIADVILKNNW